MSVRVRFAPSPTGYLHIGGVRTALFNWLFARHEGGRFLLRIEDTDQSRSTDEAIHAILEGLTWVGLDWDEGPYRQTERMELYRRSAFQLLESGHAYWCICTAEELTARREEALARGEPVKYDGRCRRRGITTPSEAAALRFKAPQEGHTVIQDLIKGRVEFENTVLDDLIILRSNGYPTYNFSVVVDDALMGITHVIRGDDHLTNTPRQLPLFQALGYPVPAFAHVPMIMGSDKTRLSKRHGATSVLAYRDMGYLPEALLNYLVRLGWAHGDQEIFTRDELIEKFSIENIQKSAAVFNPDKLQWVNAQYLQHSVPVRVADALAPFLDKLGLGEAFRAMSDTWQAALVQAFRERSRTLEEMARWAVPYVKDEVELEKKAAEKFLTPAIVPALEALHDGIKALAGFTATELEPLFQNVLAEQNLKMGQLAQPVRVALTGGTASPGIYEVMLLLGRERTLKRLHQGIEHARGAMA